MPPMTRGMARKGIRHYAPYNLCSPGPDQTLLDLSTPPFTPRTPVRLRNAVGARGIVPPPPHIHTAEGNPAANGNEFIYPDIRKAIRDGVPPVLCIYHLSFVPSILNPDAVGEEQKKILQALEANEIISQERLVHIFILAIEMVGQHTVEYIEECVEIAIGTLANEIEKYGFSMIDED
ncbi:hypothetical protein PISMIDRAFT_24331 [Pisolithus microcarpus 441]|uniref:Uncharacterized protein n=1 Tax=Pisolithus microcarpus 441 TaxID=765257 RepID=A0A0C9YSJ6_9AGAM|nr:hypothetical protein PISMIDRAFT_24331 [Pisolithus microcarpus 441]